MLRNAEQVASEANEHLNSFAEGLPAFLHETLGEAGMQVMVSHAEEGSSIPQMLGEVAGKMHGKEPDNPFKNELERSAHKFVLPKVSGFLVKSGLWVPVDGYPEVSEYNHEKSFGENITGAVDYEPKITEEAKNADYTADTGAQLRGLKARLQKLKNSWERGVTSTGVQLSGMRELTDAEFINFNWEAEVGGERPFDEFNAVIKMAAKYLDLGNVEYIYDATDTMIAARLTGGTGRELIVANAPLTTGPALNRSDAKPAPRAPQGLKMLVDNAIIEPGSTVAFGGTVPHAPSRQHYEAANVLQASDREYTLVRGVTGIPSPSAITASLLAGEMAGIARNTTRSLFGFEVEEFADSTLVSDIRTKVSNNPNQLDEELSKIWAKRIFRSVTDYVGTTTGRT